MGITLPHDVVEIILESLPVKTLIRFTSVSKIWRFTIESQRFKKKHMIRGQLHGDPDILILQRWNPQISFVDASLVTLTFESTTMPVSYKTQTIPGKANTYKVSHSCDGLVCIYDFEKLMCVMNPATRWQRSLPQPVVLEKYQSIYNLIKGLPSLGFGKDKIRGIYKMAWLYKYQSHNYTTCELFSFATNTWKYLTFRPFQILCTERPVYADGSLYWFVQGNQEKDTITDILCFDLHTESLSVLSNSPVTQTRYPLTKMISLDNRLCVSVQRSGEVDIWLLNPDNTWKNPYMFTYPFGTADWFGVQVWSMSTVAVFGKKKKTHMVYDWNIKQSGLALFDRQPEITVPFFRLPLRHGEIPTPYYPSLITI